VLPKYFYAFTMNYLFKIKIIELNKFISDIRSFSNSLIAFFVLIGNVS